MKTLKIAVKEELIMKRYVPTMALSIFVGFLSPAQASSAKACSTRIAIRVVAPLIARRSWRE
jgi:hypothetical protein